MTTATANEPATKRPRRMAREPKPQDSHVTQNHPDAADASANAPPPKALKTPTKADMVVGLLSRDVGATLAQMIEVTGWLPHTTRAALTGLKKKGYAVTGTKADGVRTYRIPAAQQAHTEASTASGSTPDI